MSGEALFVELWGEGPPVVFLHGLGGSARYWQRVREASDGYAGLAPDLLGFGRSPSPADAPYDVDGHLATLVPLIPPASLLVAHSTGGVLAAAIAARHPDRLRALVLVGLPAFPDEATARREVGRLGLLARLTVDGSRWAKMLCGAMCRLRPLATVLAPYVVRDLPPSIASDGARHTWPSYSRTLDRVVVGHRVGPDLAAAAMPITLVHGRGDRVAAPAHVEGLAADARVRGRPLHLRLVEGDHHLPVRRADVVVDVMAEALGLPIAPSRERSRDDPR